MQSELYYDKKPINKGFKLCLLNRSLKLAVEMDLVTVEEGWLRNCSWNKT